MILIHATLPLHSCMPPPHSCMLPCSNLAVHALQADQVADVERLVADLRHRAAVLDDVQRFLAAGCDPGGWGVVCF